MKRWIRRILMGCSIALMVAAVGLYIRGLYAMDYLGLKCMQLTNGSHAVHVAIYSPAHFIPFYYDNYDPSYLANPLLPQAYFTNGSFDFQLPHWLLLIIGAYLMSLWLRGRAEGDANVQE